MADVSTLGNVNSVLNKIQISVTNIGRLKYFSIFHFSVDFAAHQTGLRGPPVEKGYLGATTGYLSPKLPVTLN